MVAVARLSNTRSSLWILSSYSFIVSSIPFLFFLNEKWLKNRAISPPNGRPLSQPRPPHRSRQPRQEYPTTPKLLVLVGLMLFVPLPSLRHSPCQYRTSLLQLTAPTQQSQLKRKTPDENTAPCKGNFPFFSSSPIRMRPSKRDAWTTRWNDAVYQTSPS